MIPTTYVPGYSSATIQTVPYLTARERDGIIDALDAGELIGVVDTNANAIVAVATPKLAGELTARDDDAVSELRHALNNAASDLRAAFTIIGEVFAEKEPSDYRYRLEDAIEDVERMVNAAIDTAEEM